MLVKNFVEKEMMKYLGKIVEVDVEVSDGISFHNYKNDSTSRQDIEEMEKKEM